MLNGAHSLGHVPVYCCLYCRLMSRCIRFQPRSRAGVSFWLAHSVHIYWHGSNKLVFFFGLCWVNGNDPASPVGVSIVVGLLCVCYLLLNCVVVLVVPSFNREQKWDTLTWIRAKKEGTLLLYLVSTAVHEKRYNIYKKVWRHSDVGGVGGDAGYNPMTFWAADHNNERPTSR